MRFSVAQWTVAQYDGAGDIAPSNVGQTPKSGAQAPTVGYSPKFSKGLNDDKITTCIPCYRTAEHNRGQPAPPPTSPSPYIFSSKTLNGGFTLSSAMVKLLFQVIGLG